MSGFIKVVPAFGEEDAQIFGDILDVRKSIIPKPKENQATAIPDLDRLWYAECIKDAGGMSGTILICRDKSPMAGIINAKSWLIRHPEALPVMVIEATRKGTDEPLVLGIAIGSLVEAKNLVDEEVDSQCMAGNKPPLTLEEGEEFEQVKALPVKGNEINSNLCKVYLLNENGRTVEKLF